MKNTLYDLFRDHPVSVPLIGLAALGLLAYMAVRLSPTTTRRIAMVGMLCWAAVLIPVTLSGLPVAPEFTSQYSLMPGAFLDGLLHGDSRDVRHALGNVLLFAPFGALATIAFRGSLIRVAILATVLSVGIEAAQYLMRTGRVADVDDVILNVAGAMMGSLLFRGVLSILTRGRVGRTNQ